MPVSYSSPARNLFLLGSSGSQVVTNFFKKIVEADNFSHIASEIRYLDTDGSFVIAGEADRTSPSTQKFGWIEKKQEDGTEEWGVEVESTDEGDTIVTALELDGSNLVAVGTTNNIPWIAKYTTDGVSTWSSTSYTGDLKYTGVSVDGNGNYYACGSTPDSASSTSPALAFVENFDSSGNPGWGKSAFMLGRNVVLNDIATNDRGHVVSVGYLEDDTANKGYIVKIDTNTRASFMG